MRLLVAYAASSASFKFIRLFLIGFGAFANAFIIADQPRSELMDSRDAAVASPYRSRLRLSWLLFLFRGGFESFEGIVPEAVEPVAHCGDTAVVDLIHIASALGMNEEQTGVPENFEVLGNGGARHSESLRQLDDGEWPFGKAFKELTAGWVTEGCKGPCCVRLHLR